jgi:hypothetical protein
MGFSIDYLGVRMGTASIRVNDPEGALQPVELEAHTTGVASALYDFREKLVSRLDAGTGLPAEGIIDTAENSRRHHDTTEYRRPEGKAVVIQRGRTTSTDLVAIQPETVDFVALVFQLRRMELEPGARRTFSVLSGTDVHAVITEVLGRETVNTPAGTFAALKVRVPTGFTGKFSEKNPTFLWLSDDPRRVVVRIATEFSFGGAVASLVSYKPGSADAPSGEAGDGG